MLLVYCSHKTKRLEYIFDFLLKEIAGIHFQFTEDRQEYEQWHGASLNYSQQSLKTTEVFYTPERLLFEADIHPQNISIERNGEFACLYFNDSAEKIFDPFAASFFLVSRYEEYLPFTPDKHGRFEAGASIQYQQGLLYIPLVNAWAEEIKNKIQSKFPSIAKDQREFQALISIDIDQAYAFKHRGFIKNSISFVKNAMQLDAAFLRSQLKTLSGQSKDPYDSFDYLREKQQELGLDFIYFVNVGRYSNHDKNIPLANSAFKQLLIKIASHSKLGLHPSYYSSSIPQKLLEEKKELEKALKTKVVASRQHYLKLSLPATYHALINAGIKEDYSMGYASHPGFRAGTCSPFNWFDLSNNCVEDLKIYPITYMEGTFFEYLKMSPEEADQASGKLIDIVYKYNGLFLSIWHNNTVSGTMLWKDWRNVFENSLNKIKSLIHEQSSLLSS